MKLLTILTIVLALGSSWFVQTGLVLGAGGIPGGPGMKVRTICTGSVDVQTYNGDNGWYRQYLPPGPRMCVTQAWSVRGGYTSGPVLFLATGTEQRIDLELRRPAW